MSKPELPKEAQRRGGADTLFSAEWFDADDNPGAIPEDNLGGEKPKPKAKPASAPPPESTGPNYLLIGGVLLVCGMLFMTCAGIGGAGAMYYFMSASAVP